MPDAQDSPQVEAKPRPQKPKSSEKSPPPPNPEDLVEAMSADEVGGWVMVMTQMMAIAGIAVVGWAAWPWEWLSFIFVGMGALCLVAGVRSLSKSLSVHPFSNGQGLRTGGIYSAVRHPMYLGLLLLGLGICLDGPAGGWVAFALLFVSLISKISIEEKSLAQAYPEWESYRSGTKKLIPGIW